MGARAAGAGWPERGQGTVEYVGLVLLVAVLIAGVVEGGGFSDTGIAEAVVKKLKEAIDGVGEGEDLGDFLAGSAVGGAPPLGAARFHRRICGHDFRPQTDPEHWAGVGLFGGVFGLAVLLLGDVQSGPWSDVRQVRGLAAMARCCSAIYGAAGRRLGRLQYYGGAACVLGLIVLIALPGSSSRPTGLPSPSRDVGGVPAERVPDWPA